ncbi:protein FAR1-RELATED SEQUENCE 5-like [Salvia splendens]|uniref:protein FAR1-RELATED SEQUENCE 5-like n=1 Tax=Salvia splendens TaxID=180675 RepID=UPI001C281441|nr:protein FAR1-RELATED SEQUENCE 5-like [Salvia splendens]
MHMLSSQRNITDIQAHEIDLANDVGIMQKSTFNLMTRQAGGRDGIGYTILDAKNYLRSKRQTSMDQAMAKALNEVMPDTFHGLCTWHLMQNGIKHLGNLMKEGSCFVTDFKRCMYGFEDETQFEEAWGTLLSEFKLRDNTWLKHVYNVKEKWARCCMNNAFTLGMRSTQLSKSVNSSIKNCTKPNLNIEQIFKNFEQVVEEKRYNELQRDFEAPFDQTMFSADRTYFSGDASNADNRDRDY